MFYKKCLFSLLISLFFLQVALADTGFRRYAGEFMAIDVSARAQALGGAFSALSNDVYATFYNPAGLAQIQSAQVGFTHTRQFISSINYDYIGFAKPFGTNKAIGFSLIRLGVDDIKDSRAAAILGTNGELLDIDESQISSFNSSDYVFFVSLGNRMSSKLSWGFNMKLVRRNLADHSANGLGFDAGLLYKVNNNLKISGMFRNITSTLVAWDTGEKELVSPTLRFGSAYLLPLPGLNSQFIPTVDFIVQTQGAPGIADNLGSQQFTGAFGGELIVQETLSLRGGYDDLQRMNLGIGIHIPHIQVDYAFTSFDQELGNAHRIGLLIDFDK